MLLTGRRATCLLLAIVASAEDAASTDSTQKSASLLLPQNEADYSNFLTSLIDSQHKLLTSIHGVDSPQVALASTLLDLQGSVSTGPPAPTASRFPQAVQHNCPNYDACQPYSNASVWLLPPLQAVRMDTHDNVICNHLLSESLNAVKQ